MRLCSCGRDDMEGTIYNMVGFQTNLKWGEQKRVFSMIPGLERAEFVRYGVMHRNTYIQAPQVLNRYYQMETVPESVFLPGRSPAWKDMWNPPPAGSWPG